MKVERQIKVKRGIESKVVGYLLFILALYKNARIMNAIYIRYIIKRSS